MKKAFTAIIAVAAVAGTLAATTTGADAQWRRGPGPGAAAVIGGLAAGAIIGGAIANSGPGYGPPPPGYYYAPGPDAVYIEEPACRLVRERFWDGYAWRVRRVQVCD